jgi:hypothetical protein
VIIEEVGGESTTVDEIILTMVECGQELKMRTWTEKLRCNQLVSNAGRDE